MNSTVWHILKKDLVRFRLLLAFWCVVLVGRVMCAEWAAASEDSAQGSSAMMWPVVVFLFNVTLVVRLLAEDSPLKEAAFWRIQPISGGQMLAAKSLFIAGWTVLLPALVIAAAGFYYGFTWSEVLAVVAVQMVLHGFIAVVFLTVSAFFQRVFASVVCFFLFGVFERLATGLRVTTDTVATFERASLVATRTFLAAGFLLAACGLACWLVYQSRRRVLAGVVLALGLAGMKLTASLWSWDCLGWVSVLNNKEPKADTAYVVALAQTDSGGRSSINGVDYQFITATINEISLEQGEIARPYRFEGRVVWSDESESLQNREDSIPRSPDPETLLRSLGIERVSRSRYARIGLETVNLAYLRDAELGKLRQVPAEWRGRISSVVGRLAVKARIPLNARAVAGEGAYLFSITDLLVGGDELKVNVVERCASSPNWRFGVWESGDLAAGRLESYALINVRRKEAILPASFGGRGGRGGMGGGLLEFSRAEIRFSAEMNSNKMTPVEWADWLRDAELVRFQFQEERRVITGEMAVPLTFRQ